MEFTQSECGLMVPVTSNGTEDSSRDAIPVKAGWAFSMCGERWHSRNDEKLVLSALESLYIAIDPGGGRIPTQKSEETRQRRIRMLNELAVELVGGIPESYEQYT